MAPPIYSHRSNSPTDIGCQQTFVFPKGVHWRHWSTPSFVILVGGGGALHRPICAVRTAAPEVGWSMVGVCYSGRYDG